ncbi:hypothetical protein EDC64_11588 [Aquabacter spiritensis]|uniref:Uncharacterized protein n=1 Tax=Aquabacter spiritensis TaxID=933073 RepID=A0A4R3LUJ4_9HYPH|nr:hypothetical protein EDC64_11588 [Aquabacter spiritensis]
MRLALFPGGRDLLRGDDHFCYELPDLKDH